MNFKSALRIALVATLVQGWIFVVMSSLEGKHHHSRLSQYTDLLCPYNVICREGGPMLEPASPDRQGCCTDCSCSEDCGLTENCCFPALDNYQLVDRTRQKCIDTGSDKDGLVITGYHMVVDSFPLGSGEDCGNEDTPCGEDEDATAIGSLYPVFSKKTGRIYKNVKCAKCHGQGESDIVQWAAYIVCDELRGLDASTIFQFFGHNHTMDPKCKFRFLYPGPSLDILGEKCYLDVAESCALDDEFPIPEGLNMSQEEIRAGCNSTLNSPVYHRKGYKNVFCAICYSIAFFGYKPLQACSLQPISDGEKSTSGFSALLDPGEVGHLRRPNTRDNEQLACKPKSNTANCRLVQCPSGKARLKSGQCGYPAKYWNIKVMKFYLKLIPKQEIKVSSIPNIDVNKALSVSPWPKIWRLGALLYSNKTRINNNVSIIDCFLVRMDFTGKMRNDMNGFMQNIARSMSKEWTLYFNNSPFSHRQEFSEFENFHFFGKTAIPKTNWPGYPALSFIRNLTVPTFRFLVDYPSPATRYSSIIINKMFFCEQICLKPGEYEYDNKLRILILNATGRFFFSGEIAATYDVNLGYVPNICLEDSGFSRPNLSDSGATGSIRKYPLSVVLYFVFTLLSHKIMSTLWFELAQECLV